MQLVVVPTGGHLQELVKRMQAIQKDGSKVLLVSATRPFTELRAALDDAGIDGIMILDMLSTSLGAAPHDRPRDTVFLPSPTMLEMAAMRVEQMHRLMGGEVHVVLDCLDFLAQYSPRKAVEEFTHYLVNRLRSIDAAGDLLVTDNDEGRAILEAARPYTDGDVHIKK